MASREGIYLSYKAAEDQCDVTIILSWRSPGRRVAVYSPCGGMHHWDNLFVSPCVESISHLDHISCVTALRIDLS